MRVNDNMRYAAKNGYWKAGKPSYGYSYTPGEKILRVNESEAQIVRMIYERIANEVPVSQLVKELRRLNLYGRPRKYRRDGI
jgi:DNA invertase Pin-like site-specific DNA recombinase